MWASCDHSFWFDTYICVVHGNFTKRTIVSMRMDSAQDVHTFLSSKINALKGPMESLKRHKIFTFTSYEAYISTSILKLEMIVPFVIHNCSPYELCLTDQMTKNVCGVGSVNDWPHTLVRSIWILDILKKLKYYLYKSTKAGRSFFQVYCIYSWSVMEMY